nr:retrotransposon Orf1 [Tanacetum cinerariifolium]
MDFAKPVKEISLPQDVPSTSDRHLIELENQVQRLMEARLSPKKPIQVNKITSSCEICSGSYDTQYCMENPEQAFLSMRPRVPTKREASGTLSNLSKTILPGKFQNGKPEKEEQEEKDNPKNLNTKSSSPPDPSVSFIIEKVRKLNSFFESIGLVPSHPTQNLFARKGIMVTSELAYHKYLMSGPIPLIFMRNPIITEGCLSNLKIPCNIRHVHVEKSYIDLNSHLNVMTRTLYNWIMRRKLDPRGDPNGRVRNFTGRIKGMHVFIGNFTYITYFMIVKDISLIVDPRLSQVVLGNPFVEISNMTHDPPEGVARFTNGTNEIAYKMPHKIEKYNSLSDLEKEHTKSVYFRNQEDKRRRVDYVMSKILGFYKECLELGPEYLTGIADEGEVT